MANFTTEYTPTRSTPVGVTPFYLPEINTKECANKCGTPHGLSFCSHIDFPTCRERNSWNEQDAKAKADYEHTLAFIAFDSNENGDDFEEEEACASALHDLKKIHCALQFPICERGTSTERLCFSSCEQALVSCAPLRTASFCSNTNLTRGYLYADENLLLSDGQTNSQCFTLDYTGQMYGLWVAGFTISVVFSILNSIGINLQKYSLQANAKEVTKRVSCCQPIWMLGFILICTGSLLDFVAFGMAPQSLLAPLAALSLVWNLIIAPIIHKETITRHNLIATAIIFLGVTMTVIFAGHSTPSYDLDDLLQLYCKPIMFLYIASIIIFVACLWQAKTRIERTGVGVNELYHVICYGGIAGSFGGQSVLLAKSVVELIKTALWGSGTMNAFKHYETYVMIGGLATCLICQITTLNGGLERFDALVMVPVYQSFWILTSVLGGIIYFEEYISMTPFQALMFTAGSSITLFGIYYLLAGQKPGLISYTKC